MRTEVSGTAKPASFDRDQPRKTPAGTNRGRLAGVDLARLLAVAGMVMVHFGPSAEPTSVSESIYQFSHGRASILFAVLAGVGVSLLVRRRKRNQRFLAYGEILMRAAILLPLGLWLQVLDHNVLVILQFYAIYFVFTTLIVGLPDRVLIALGLFSVVIGPFAYHAIVQVRPEWFAAHAPELGDSAGKIVRDVLISGHYPLITWAAPLVVGVWLGRRNLWSMRTRLLIVVAGLLVMLVTRAIANVVGATDSNSESTMLSTAAHSQTHFWMIDAIGAAVLVLGLSLLVADGAGRLATPFVMAGQLALTIYVLHLLILHVDSDLLRRDTVSEAYQSVVMFMACTIVLSALWRAVFPRGPLETAIRAPWQLVRHRFERLQHVDNPHRP